MVLFRVRIKVEVRDIVQLKEYKYVIGRHKRKGMLPLGHRQG